MALTIKVKISDEQEICLKHDLLDIEDWVQKAVIGKINNCQKRMILQGYKALLDDPTVTTIPAEKDALIKCCLARPDYKNREERDAATV